jgi:hypothetical protein
MTIMFLFAAVYVVFMAIGEKSLNLLLCISVVAFNCAGAFYFADIPLQDERTIFLSLLAILSLCYVMAVTHSVNKIRNSITYTVMSFHSLGAWYMLSKMLWF